MLTRLLHRHARRFIDVFVDTLMTRARLHELHPHTLMLRQAQAEAAEYARSQMAGAMVFQSQRDILVYALKKAALKGLTLEFGVAEGVSIGTIARAVEGAVHGFDSFEGLPEDWPGRHEPQGAYSRAGSPPKVPKNVTLHQGWFEATLPAFLKTHEGPVSFLHVDCDLYRSTKTVLDLLSDRIVPGTVIVFDEYFNYLSWRDHEFKAFHEFVNARGVRYTYVAWAYQQAAVLITGVSPAPSPTAERSGCEALKGPAAYADHA